MNLSSLHTWSIRSVTIILLVGLVPAIVRSHCDTMNGPVVLAAKKALETGDVNLVLIWVQKKDEAEVRDAFQKTLAVRKLNADARTLADMYFFETLVRIHRAGEGVAYTGLKPADTEVDPGIAAADKALESGSVRELLHHLEESLLHNLDARFKGVTEKKNFKPGDVNAGREYVKAYVEFIHFVERLHQAITQPVEGHSHEAGAVGTHHGDH